jgi:hypothetical protein
MTRTHQPKGGMCLRCTRAAARCSHLPFESMSVIEQAQGVTVVR